MKSHPRSTQVSRYIKAPRPEVYKALTDVKMVAQWKVPPGMTFKVHSFDAREGGTLRVSLTYTEPTETGKTTTHTDTYHGRFVKLIPDEMVVEEDEFETTDPALQGIMTSTMTLKDHADGTEITGLHENLPPGLSLSDNEKGWELTFEKLAALLENKNNDK